MKIVIFDTETTGLAPKETSLYQAKTDRRSGYYNGRLYYY